MIVQTFMSGMSEPKKASKEAEDFLARMHGNYDLVSMKTTTNDYYFYITVVMKPF